MGPFSIVIGCIFLFVMIFTNNLQFGIIGLADIIIGLYLVKDSA